MAGNMDDAGAPRGLKSAAAVVAAFMVVVGLSSIADAVMHATGVFPPVSERMEDTKLFLLALAYRCVFTVLGGWVAARLAPFAPMKHVAVVAGIGLVIGTLGAVASVVTHLGPAWYAIAVAVTGPLFTLLGGWLHERKAQTDQAPK